MPVHWWQKTRRKLFLKQGGGPHLPGLLRGVVLFGLWSGVPSAQTQELPPGFVSETLATRLNAATALAALPDGRILLAEQTGRILVWKKDRLLEQPALVLPVTDYWERGLIGLTMHPDFPAVPHVFVCYVTDRPYVHHVVARFTLEGDLIDPASEVRLLEGDDQELTGGFKKSGHQGGAMRFGHDGKLYVSIGEQTARSPSQDLGALQGSILRLNSDGSIPDDNPFLDKTTGKYRAIYAMGVRNSFGLAVQPRADGGRIFFTDVGESRFEEVNELVAGGNYGWPEQEGPSKDPRFVAPIYAYNPAVGRSICGGLFYPRHPNFGPASFPEKWRGQFFFADWAHHWIKTLDPDHPAEVRTFAVGFNGPVALEWDAAGNLLVLNRGTIWRDEQKFVENSGSLMRIRYVGRDETDPEGTTNQTSPPAALGLPSRLDALPPRLSGLMLFPWLRSEVLDAPGIGEALPGVLWPYTLNGPPWQPGIAVRRWVALPENTSIRFSPTQDWELPRGAALIQHYEEFGPERRPLETRFLVVGERMAYGVAYKWATDGSDADLVEELDVAALQDGSLWPIPAADPYLSLPSTSLFFATDLSTRQLNRPGPGNPVREMARHGLLIDVPDDDVLSALPVLAAYDDEKASIELRVRSYLDVNCAVCHRPGGNARAHFDARLLTPLGEAQIIHGILESGDLGISEARVVVPGHPDKSILYRRLAADDFFRMPPVQYHNRKPPILPLLRDWILSLP